ncbi:hypothetical protein D0T87_12965 [Bacteroides sp. 51]|nr:hypothetical protein [Bacteroides sp. 51]
MQILGGVIAIIVFVVVVRIHSTEANVSIEGEEIRIEGSYGERFSLDDLSQVNLVDTLPVIKSRTDGYSFASVKKGYFRTESGERIKLFLHVADGPFLKIQRKDDIPVFINYSDSSKTQQVYKEILAQINK